MAAKNKDTSHCYTLWYCKGLNFLLLTEIWKQSLLFWREDTACFILLFLSSICHCQSTIQNIIKFICQLRNPLFENLFLMQDSVSDILQNQLLELKITFIKITLYQSLSSVPFACWECRTFHIVTSAVDIGFWFSFEYEKYPEFQLLWFSSSIKDCPCIFIGVIYFTFEVNTNLSEILARSVFKLYYVEIMPKYKQRSVLNSNFKKMLNSSEKKKVLSSQMRWN